ncbi:MAG: amidohydrolase, partial [Actinobacteria bacterium]|nr:amidohydrolase [Actinomycetota bacterium]
MSTDLYLHGGTIISGGRTISEATIRIRDGVIDDVSHELPPSGARVIDTTGSLMIPGVINT